MICGWISSWTWYVAKFVSAWSFFTKDGPQRHCRETWKEIRRRGLICCEYVEWEEYMGAVEIFERICRENSWDAKLDEYEGNGSGVELKTVSASHRLDSVQADSIRCSNSPRARRC